MRPPAADFQLREEGAVWLPWKFGRIDRLLVD